MKWFIGVVFIMIALSGCSHHIDEPYYDRANAANDKAQADLQK
nr:hypothetical protein [Sulfurimonas sp. SAG-AH-194-L11]